MSQTIYNSESEQICPSCHAHIARNAPVCESCGLILQREVSASFKIPTLDMKPQTLAANNTPLVPLAVSQTVPLLKTGTQIANFQIEFPLNDTESSLNRYKAQSSDGKYYLLKETYAEQPLAVRLNEIHQILQTVSHPALPQSSQLFQHGNLVYQCLEWGGDQFLRDFWKNSPDEHLGWVQQLCNAVSTLNQQNVVCLELQPSNLFLRSGNALFIQDFTLLRYLPLDSTSRIPQSFYVAPEVYSQPYDVSQRADVYAIGAAWLSLQLNSEIHSEHLRERYLLTPLELPEFDAALPAVNRLIARCLAPIERRYKSTRMLQAAVQQAANESTELAHRVDWNNLGAWSDMGMARDNNEDNFFAHIYDNYSGNPFTLAILADGMGGEEGGEVASAMVVQSLSSNLPDQIQKVLGVNLIKPSPNNARTVLTIENNAKQPQNNQGVGDAVDSQIQELLNHFVSEASRQVYDRAQQERQLKSMGSTVVVALMLQNSVWIANVGDSRAYCLKIKGKNNKSHILQLSQEHIRIAELRRRNQVVNSQDEANLQGILARNIGFQNSANSFVRKYPLELGDYILLCCDGLTDALSDLEILEIISSETNQNSRPIVMCKHLVNKANGHDGHDNVTVILYRHS